MSRFHSCLCLLSLLASCHQPLTTQPQPLPAGGTGEPEAAELVNADDAGYTAAPEPRIAPVSVSGSNEAPAEKVTSPYPEGVTPNPRQRETAAALAVDTSPPKPRAVAEKPPERPTQPQDEPKVQAPA
ncbi:MAG: hypothetical protein ACQKBY_13610, partial [Verrucomicrobiales bacterium]